MSAPTPETDAARLDEHDPAQAIAALCGRLERERNEARAALADIRLQHSEEVHHLTARIDVLKAERDEAWEDLSPCGKPLKPTP